MSWPDRYRRQAHMSLMTHEAIGLPFFYAAAQTYLDLATEWDERKAEDSNLDLATEWDERKAEDSNPSAETPHRLATGRTPMGT